ncbi:unnamed protein product [Paramecium pentaurelia]|uniref:Myosin motor domain-containing protein n=1 Tax=Paramecium pentaurelia TaxID=43138 RepID=A0A8S1TY29_9CILI|nr:unnamed protein product [Paramecium pentaurelia]
MAKKSQPQLDLSWVVPNALCWQDLDNKDPMFSPAVVISSDGKIITIKLESGGQIQCKPTQVLERADPTILGNKGFDDMVNMEILNDAELLNNLIYRFGKDIIFTYVGPTLLVINPFKQIQGLMGADIRNQYIDDIVKKNRLIKDLPPHVYAIAAQAYRQLFENEKNQAIVISGESGAGKTENAKFSMNLLTSIASDGSSKDKIEDQILGCNPILEAFGNAKTVRNNNSSRFGKYVRIIVDDKTRQIKGAEIINYLMEKSRINQQGKNERNFHIFYFFLQGLPQELLNKFGVTMKMEEFNYLNSSKTYTIPNVDDAEMFKEIQESFSILGMQNDFENIVQTVLAVLHLGNLEFNISTLTDTQPASVNESLVEHLLELSNQQLSQALTLKSRVINKQTILSPLTPDECQFTRDSLAKDIYDRLFNWLVIQLNKVLKPKVESKTSVGLLDIYGFEVFDKNGFEQIMINYTNEKLHQLYIQYVFKEEEKIFIEEGLKDHLGQLEFQDNTSVIELIDKQPGGIFSILDESCSVKSTDDGFLQKIRTVHKSNPLIKTPKMPSDPSFILVHTAKDVCYTVTGFREKNKDEMSVQTISMISQTKNPLLKQLYTMEGMKEKMISQKIKKEMIELMTELHQCDVHFIRCIKPNESKLPNQVFSEMTLKQIRYLGVLDSLKVRKESYSIRRPYQFFYKRYADMTRNEIYSKLIKKPDINFRQLVLDMFKQHMPHIDSKQVLFGKTKIFIRNSGLQMIEDSYNKIVTLKHQRAAKLQRSYKIYKMNQHLKKMMRIAMTLRTLAQRIRFKVQVRKRVKAASVIQAWYKKLHEKRLQQKYEKSALYLKLYFERYNVLRDVARKKLAISKIQKFGRYVVQSKQERKVREIKNVFQKIIDDAWQMILVKKAIIIQSNFRGSQVRKKNKKQVHQIKNAGRKIKMEASVIKVQAAIRRFIARSQFRRAHDAAYLIQGYFRMKLLSTMFQRMRAAARCVQKFARIYLQKQMAYKKNYESFVLPWEKNVQQQKHDASNLWVLTNENIENEEIQPLLETCLIQWRPRLPKIALFSVPIDIDILSDIYQCYNPNYSYSRTLLNIIIQQFRKDHPIQSYFTTEESTLCVTLGGTAIFEFGSGQLILNKDTFDTVEKNIFPDFIRIKSISCSDEFILVTTADGSLLQYGDQYKQIKYKPHYINKECTMSSKKYIVSDNKVFSLINLNVNIPIKQKAKMISCGNQFIVTLCESGQLYSWGENYEGELGLGDRRYRHEPCLINIEKVLQVCCGFKHVIAKTRSKIYTWGWGERGQLGNSELKNEFLPKPLNITALWVSAGRTSSSIITNDRIIMQCGTNSILNHQEKFEPVTLSFTLNSMIPIRIISTWSKIIEITYVTFANTISLPENQLSKSLKILNHLNQIWSESSDPHSIDPPFNQSISNYLYEASMRKSNQFNKQQIKNHFKLQKEMLYIEDDRDWAMRKKILVEDIKSHQKTVTKTDKIKAIRQRFLDLMSKSEDQMTNDDKAFINQIQNNEKIQALLKSIEQ